MAIGLDPQGKTLVARFCKVVQLRLWVPVLLALLASTPAWAASRARGKARPASRMHDTPAADSDKDQAREHARKGNAAYNLGRFEEAATHYEAAYRLVQDPNILFNVAQANRLSGQPEKALAAYKGFLRTAPATHPKRGQAQEHVAELEATPQRPLAVPAETDRQAPQADGDEFNPFARLATKEEPSTTPPPTADDGEMTSDNLIRRTNPTVGGTLMFANQNGITGGRVTRGQAFVRVKHNGRKYEAGYFDLPIFAPNPEYTSSALYFRFTSENAWWAQAGALGRNGNFHAGGGLDWQYFSLAARIENVGGRALCSAPGESATYIVPEANLRVPVIPGITIGLLGNFRHALLSTDTCVFHPSMTNVDAGVDWTWGEDLVLRGGFGVYQFIGADAVPTGPWPGDHSDTAGHGFFGARYQWKKHIALLGSYRRIFYSEGVNQVLFHIEASLGEL